MSHEQATKELNRGNLVAAITIPAGFSNAIKYGETVPIPVAVDNVDTDLTDDIQRALPSAITFFAKQISLPDIRVHVIEHDLLPHDTNFIPYLVVSALALDAFIVAGILSAVAVAQEFETGTSLLLAIAPGNPLFALIGRMLIADLVAFVSMLVSAGIVIFGYGVVPLHPTEVIITIITCVIIFGCMGAMLGVALKRTLPVASLIFGLALPLYIDSGSLEPERFDGNVIWGLAHLSPIYYAVGMLEHAFHGFQVTPEPIFLDFLLLVVWAVGMLSCTGFIVRRQFSR
jgi:ABC-type multidrug transport system permease subunit